MKKCIESLDLFKKLGENHLLISSRAKKKCKKLFWKILSQDDEWFNFWKNYQSCENNRDIKLVTTKAASRWRQFYSLCKNKTFSENKTFGLYVLIMSRTRFRVNPHAIFAGMSRNSLLKAGMKFKWLLLDSNPQPLSS